MRVPDPRADSGEASCEINLREGGAAHRAPDGGGTDVQQRGGAFEIDDVTGLVEQVRFGEARAEVARLDRTRPSAPGRVVEQRLRTGGDEAANPKMNGRAGNANSRGDVGGGQSLEPVQHDPPEPTVRDGPDRRHVPR